MQDGFIHREATQFSYKVLYVKINASISIEACVAFVCFIMIYYSLQYCRINYVSVFVRKVKARGRM